jgi:hypothetical protein
LAVKVNEYQVIHTAQGDGNISTAEIQDHGGGEKLILSTFKDMVSVRVENAELRFHDSMNLMGTLGPEMYPNS